MFDTPPSNYQQNQGDGLFEKRTGPDASVNPNVEKICQALQSLIDSESKNGDSKAAAKLQDAYDLIEEYKDQESSETPDAEGTGSPEGADQDMHGTGETGTMTNGNINTGLLMGPMSNLKNYLARKSVDTQDRPFVS